MVDVEVERGTATLEQKLKVITSTANPTQHGKVREAFGALEMAKMDTPEKTDNKTNRTPP